MGGGGGREAGVAIGKHIIDKKEMVGWVVWTPVGRISDTATRTTIQDLEYSRYTTFQGLNKMLFFLALQEGLSHEVYVSYFSYWEKIEGNSYSMLWSMCFILRETSKIINICSNICFNGKMRFTQYNNLHRICCSPQFRLLRLCPPSQWTLPRLM